MALSGLDGQSSRSAGTEDSVYYKLSVSTNARIAPCSSTFRCACRDDGGHSAQVLGRENRAQDGIAIVRESSRLESNRHSGRARSPGRVRFLCRWRVSLTRRWSGSRRSRETLGSYRRRADGAAELRGCSAFRRNQALWAQCEDLEWGCLTSA